ncbi:MAG: pantoate--beta-alanine ligase [Acidobacteriia bacterium]|nr:pantoate--beta-alanine ligase [Terriglobia bacterium]
MQTIIEIHDLRRARAARPGTFGLIPTMGALHEGHLSLVRRARSECDHVGVSVFVNPAQFGANEDLNLYPRDLDRDLKLLEPLGVDLVWTPAPETVYPPAFQTWVTVEEVSKGLEGGRRPGHFRGVATVVAKLFNIFAPDKAYFGQKDAQQVVVIKRMVEDLGFPIEIVVCPTVREPDGLALSSRNVYLSPDERRAAPVLHRALSAARAAYESGERNAGPLRAAMKAVLDAEPLARVDYVSAADPATLAELDQVEAGILCSLAVRIGRTRLIDNLLLFPEGAYAARH